MLANAVRDGYTVVCSEPTAALMLRQEYVKLTEDLDAELVAAHTMDVGQYLLGLDARGQLPRPREPLHARVGYHQPCHLRALDVGTPGLEILRNVLGLDVEFIDRGCSGMGGTYGLARDRFWTSLRAGRGLLRRLRDGDIEIGATECGACRIQMEQGATKRTLAPDQAPQPGLRPEPVSAAALQRLQTAPRHVVTEGEASAPARDFARSAFRHQIANISFPQLAKGGIRGGGGPRPGTRPLHLPGGVKAAPPARDFARPALLPGSARWPRVSDPALGWGETARFIRPIWDESRRFF